MIEDTNSDSEKNYVKALGPVNGKEIRSSLALNKKELKVIVWVYPVNIRIVH